MKQILLNLLSNAIKFTPADGAIQVTATTAAHGLVLAVTDTGVGIAPEHIKRILKPFEQVDTTLSRKHPGTGLGLSITRHLAELHGAALDIESPGTGGPRVSITLPVTRLLKAVA